jgi:hypothetical protein
MTNLYLRFFLKMLTLSFFMLVIIARFKPEQCHNRYSEIVSSGESFVFSCKTQFMHVACMPSIYSIPVIYCSDKTLFIVRRIII